MPTNDHRQDPPAQDGDCRLVGEGQLERERRALVRGRMDVELATVGLRDRAGDEEAQARAGPRGAGSGDAAELLEDQLLVLLGNPGAVVVHVDPHAAVLRIRTHLDLAPGWRVLD